MSKGFDDFLEKAKCIAEEAVKKTGKTIDISKLKMQDMQISGKLKEQYQKLGNAVYFMKKENFENPELIDAITEKIDHLIAEQEQIKKQMEVIKECKICPCCEQKNSVHANYCIKCGCDLDKKEKTEETKEEE